MGVQIEMFDSRIQREFMEFHASNPHVYSELVRLARTMLARGYKRIGIGMLWETMRYNYFISTDDPTSEWKLNNNYRSRYARLIESKEPDIAGAFETRELKS